jgi:hypothetical protein
LTGLEKVRSLVQVEVHDETVGSKFGRKRRVATGNAACQLPSWLSFTLGKEGMKRYFASLVLLCSMLRADPTFVGVLDGAKDGTFFAVSPSEGRPSKWFTLGDTFEGFSITDYRVKDEQLILKKEGQTVVLSLRKSRVREAAPLVDEASVRDLAKRIIAKWDGWDSSTAEVVVWFKTDWNIAVTRIIDGRKETRIISAPDGFNISAAR